MISPIEDFTNLMENSFVTIFKIEWWLLKYSDLYTETYDYVHSHDLIELEDGSKVYLPPNGNPTDKEIFLDLYNSLNLISEFHRNEKYFEQEMVEYYRIAQSPSDVKNWVAKNEYLGVKKYVCFQVDYLDYDEVIERIEHLNVYVRSLKELDIYVDRHNFKNTIDFIEKFQSLYY
jgi:hypothetical protein